MFIFKRNSEGEYINEKINHSLEKSLNLVAGEIDGLFLREILGEKMYEKIAKKYDACIEKNLPISYEERYRLEEFGEEKYWMTTIVPVINETMESVRIFGISREITSLRRAEKVLKDHNAMLNEEVKRQTNELKTALDENRVLIEKLKKLAMMDKLTHLCNRHKIDEALTSEIERAKRDQKPFGIIMLDIDDFKKVNDNYGHQVGDHAICEFASILRSFARESDIVGRWGGEEFVLIIPESDKESVSLFAERIRERIETMYLIRLAK